MNERIKELARKANMVEVEYSPGFPDIRYPKNFEKFAELIVKECIESIAEIADQNAEDHVVRIALAEAVLNIEDHFGVKE